MISDSAKALQPVTRTNIYQDVMESLKSYIVSNKLAPGDRLPTEAELARDLCVSRLSIREALKVFESLGVINRRTRDGTRLSEMTLKPAVDHLRFMLDVQQVPARDIAVARQVTECGIMPVIIANATEDDYKNIEAAIEALKDALETENVLLTFEADREFHCALLSATHNPALESFGYMLQEFFAYLQMKTSTSIESEQKALREHKAIYEALRERDAAKATELMRLHLRVYDNFTLGSESNN